MRIKSEKLTPAKFLLRRVLWPLQQVPKLPATDRQIAFFNRLSLPIPKRLGKIEASNILTWASTQPTYRDEYHRWELEKAAEQAEQQAQWDQEDLQNWGQAVFDLAKKWEIICDSGEYQRLIYRRGKTLSHDIALCESSTVEKSGGRFVVKVDLLMPKRKKECDFGEYLEWERAQTINADQLLYCEPVNAGFDDYEVHDYDKAMSELKSLAADFQ